MSWIAVGAFLRRVATPVITWLGSLNFWQFLCLALFCFAALQTVRVSGEKRHSAKLSAQIVKLNAELQRISTKQSEQKIVTRERIKVVEKQIRHADDEAKRIEQSPLPGNCRTPQEVRDADI